MGLGWALAGLLSAASVALPRLLQLNDHFVGGFVTAEAYAMVAGLLLCGIVMGAVDPQRAARWGVVVGLAPLVAMMVSMARKGPGNLWPIAILLSLMLGVPAAAVGAFLGKGIRHRRPAGVVVLGGLALLLVLVRADGDHESSGTTRYWGFLALAPPPTPEQRAEQRTEAWLAEYACFVTSAIPNLSESADSTTVVQPASFGGTGWVRGHAGPNEGVTALATVTLLRVPGRDSMEIRITGPMKLTFRGKLTSENEASGKWRCTESLETAPDAALGVDGEWVLRRGSWPAEELAWPVIQR